MATQHSRQGEQNHFYGKDQTGRKKGSNNNNYEKYVTKVERRWQRQSEQRCRLLRMRGNGTKQQQATAAATATAQAAAAAAATTTQRNGR